MAAGRKKILAIPRIAFTFFIFLIIGCATRMPVSRAGIWPTRSDGHIPSADIENFSRHEDWPRSFEDGGFDWGVGHLGLRKLGLDGAVATAPDLCTSATGPCSGR